MAPRMASTKNSLKNFLMKTNTPMIAKRASASKMSPCIQTGKPSNSPRAVEISGARNPSMVSIMVLKINPLTKDIISPQILLLLCNTIISFCKNIPITIFRFYIILNVFKIHVYFQLLWKGFRYLHTLNSHPPEPHKQSEKLKHQLL